MQTRFLQRPLVLSLVWMALVSAASSAIPISVTDQKGRTIEIQLISLAGDTVTFSRKGDSKEFNLPITHFADTSQDLIRKQAALLPAVLPKIEPDVVVGKRRRKDDSFYMVRQEITSTVKLTNLDKNNAVPPVDVTLIFLGQNRRTPEILTILSKQSFEASIEPGKTFSKEMRSFITAYDSDNKGFGNIGGFQYYGYVLAILGPDGKISSYTTSSSTVRKQIEEKRHLLEELLEYKQGKMLTDKLEPSSTTMIYVVPQ
jgi:hypothetical protein